MQQLSVLWRRRTSSDIAHLPVVVPAMHRWFLGHRSEEMLYSREYALVWRHTAFAPPVRRISDDVHTRPQRPTQVL